MHSHGTPSVTPLHTRLPYAGCNARLQPGQPLMEWCHLLQLCAARAELIYVLHVLHMSCRQALQDGHLPAPEGTCLACDQGTTRSALSRVLQVLYEVSTTKPMQLI